jgi:hypothetical protein
MSKTPYPVEFTVTTRRGRERLREVWTGARVERLSAEQLEAAKKAGYEPGEGGEWFVGRDPRKMTQDELRAMGHAPMSPMEAIRARCLDCCAGSSDEVHKCVAMACPSWPFRMSKNPWREVSEARREIGRRAAAKLHEKALGVGQGPALSAASDPGGEYAPLDLVVAG